MAEGSTALEVRAISGAGVESATVRAVLRIDRSAPSLAVAGAPDPDGWSRVAVQIGLRGRDQPALSRVESLVWRVDDKGESTVQGDDGAVDIADDGRHVLTVHAVDGAGNRSSPHAVRVNVDRTPPEIVAFEREDPADPALVRAVVSDATSGVVRGGIALRSPGGDWQPMETSLRDGRLLARIDDARLRTGAYEMRATAFDAAGNERVGTARVDGAPAAVTLPLRRPVVLTATRSGAKLTLRLSVDGKPLAAREISLLQRTRGRTLWRPVCGKRVIILAAAAGCPLVTDAAGLLRVRLSRGPSRTVHAQFDGDPLLLPSRADTMVRTPARVRLRATPAAVRAGGSVRFSGRLRGGHLPARGKVVEVQARVDGRWRTFAAVRTDRRGRVRHAHRFKPSSTGRTYWFRVLARRESGYPFETGTSRAVAVRVL
jgi:hypothetical protein